MQSSAGMRARGCGRLQPLRSAAPPQRRRLCVRAAVVAAAAARDRDDDVIFGWADNWLQRTTLTDGRALFAARFERALAEERERRDSVQRLAQSEGAPAAATTSERVRDDSAGDGESDAFYDGYIFTYADGCAALNGDPETVFLTTVQAQWRTNVFVAVDLTQLADGPAASGRAAVPLPLGCGPVVLAAPLLPRAYSWLPSPQLARGFGPQNPACVLTSPHMTDYLRGIQLKQFVTDETLQAAAAAFWSPLDRCLHALVADAYGLEVPADLADEVRAVAAAQQRSMPPSPRGFGRAVPKTKQAAPPVRIELSGTPEATQQWCEPSSRRAGLLFLVSVLCGI
jgi:hypothetical protein